MYEIDAWGDHYLPPMGNFGEPNFPLERVARSLRWVCRSWRCQRCCVLATSGRSSAQFSSTRVGTSPKNAGETSMIFIRSWTVTLPNPMPRLKTRDNCLIVQTCRILQSRGGFWIECDLNVREGSANLGQRLRIVGH